MKMNTSSCLPSGPIKELTSTGICMPRRGGAARGRQFCVARRAKRTLFGTPVLCSSVLLSQVGNDRLGSRTLPISYGTRKFSFRYRRLSSTRMFFDSIDVGTGPGGTLIGGVRSGPC